MYAFARVSPRSLGSIIPQIRFSSFSANYIFPVRNPSISEGWKNNFREFKALKKSGLSLQKKSANLYLIPFTLDIRYKVRERSVCLSVHPPVAYQ